MTILSVQGQSVKVGILAPRELAIHREEIYEKIVEENQLAASRASLERAQMLMGIDPALHAGETIRNGGRSEEPVEAADVGDAGDTT